ncbi:virulence factor [Burkholderia sp. 4701]|nr:virulence factor [Burkholderia sp. 4701]MXN82347.1 virulence factor [Burkholderia sp. 4812]
MSTWPRRFWISVIVLFFVSGIVFATALYQGVAYPWSSGGEMKRLVALPMLAGIAVLALTTAFAASNVRAAETTTPMQSSKIAPASSPFLAQVVGLEWLNPLQRRDYPTEWQLLWTMGLVQPNKNDDMVRNYPQKFSSPQPISIVADGNRGKETFRGFYKKYVKKLLGLFAEKYVLNPHYFYTVSSDNRGKWRELAGIRVELAIPHRLDAGEASGYLADQIKGYFEIGNGDAKELWSKNVPADVRAHVGGANAGFASLNAALDYLQAHPQESVWVMNWDAPSFPPKDEQMNENLTVLFLAGPELKTEREPLAWIGKSSTGNVASFEAKAGTTRAVQAWKATISEATRNAGIEPTNIGFVVHDAGKGSDASSARLGSLSQTLTETLPEFDYKKQTFNTSALLGDMGAGAALTDVALAISRVNHFGGSALVAGTTDPNHPTAVVVLPPAKLTPLDSNQDWFRARGEDNAYLIWWGRRHDTKYGLQGYSY